MLYSCCGDPQKSDVAIYRLELRTGRATKLPGTDGLQGPRLSPAGDRFIAVDNHRKMILVDVRTGQRALLTKRPVDYPFWSADSRYIYFNTLITSEPALFRVSVPGGKEEKITDVRFETAGVWGFWSGLAPDGSPLILRSRSRFDVYALSLSLP
jgi:hypothetical protein